MKTSKTLLGIDIGTSGLKVSIFDESGKLLAQAYRESNNIPLSPGYKEQIPEEWWQNLCSSLAEVLSGN
ncbi:carbohydrate kinase, partial [candidate division WOR-3 bacterium]|nr:carbohydrate kinase [candidate division WOR-3 bacterium]